MKVLVSAYACEPGHGSEAEAGWAWARAVASRHDVWVVTRAANRAAIEAAGAGPPRLRFVYVDLPAWARWWKRGRRGLIPYYLLWQGLAFGAARRLHREVGIDIAHHLTFASDSLPAGVGWVPGVPFVWGPVGGSTRPPRSLLRYFDTRSVGLEGIRAVGLGIGRLLFGQPQCRRAALMVAQNEDVHRRFERLGSVIVEPNVALDRRSLPSSVDADETIPRRAAFVGRVVAWKGLAIAVRALAEPAASGWHLDVFGDGSDMPRTIRLAQRLGVADRVHFHGRCERTTVLASVRRAAALVHPSTHEACGWAVAEALAVGTPVVCFDHGGPGTLVAAGGGVALRPTGRAPGDIAAALRALEQTQPEPVAMDRFLTDRLPDLADRWYTAAATPKGRVAGRG